MGVNTHFDPNKNCGKTQQRVLAKAWTINERDGADLSGLKEEERPTRSDMAGKLGEQLKIHR